MLRHPQSIAARVANAAKPPLPENFLPQHPFNNGNMTGRDEELAKAEDLLASTRLLTLTGPGGTGKTRLSLQLAANVSHRFKDGTWFVALEPVRDPGLIAGTILTTLYIPVIVGDLIGTVILVPILVYAWEPVKAQLGR